MTARPGKSKKDCIICGKAGSAYKCPRCFSCYCSKDCCATHKTTCGAQEQVTASHNAHTQEQTSTVIVPTQETSQITTTQDETPLTPLTPPTLTVTQAQTAEAPHNEPTQSTHHTQEETCPGSSTAEPTHTEKEIAIESVTATDSSPALTQATHTHAHTTESNAPTAETTTEEPVTVAEAAQTQPHSTTEEPKSESTASRLKALLAQHALHDEEFAAHDADFLLSLKKDVFLLSEEQKNRLRAHTGLQALLRSKRLRKDLALVDEAADRVSTLRNLRAKNQEFNEVVQTMYDVVMQSR